MTFVVEQALEVRAPPATDTADTAYRDLYRNP